VKATLIGLIVVLIVVAILKGIEFLNKRLIDEVDELDNKDFFGMW